MTKKDRKITGNWVSLYAYRLAMGDENRDVSVASSRNDLKLLKERTGEIVSIPGAATPLKAKEIKTLSANLGLDLEDVFKEQDVETINNKFRASTFFNQRFSDAGYKGVERRGRDEVAKERHNNTPEVLTSTIDADATLAQVQAIVAENATSRNDRATEKASKVLALASGREQHTR